MMMSVGDVGDEEGVEVAVEAVHELEGGEKEECFFNFFSIVIFSIYFIF